MKILLTVDPEIPVPPVHYGGIERIVDMLVQQLSQMGYTVILIANPESKCSAASIIYGWPGLSSNAKIDTLKNSIFLYKIINKEKPVIVHSFSRLFYLFPILLFKRIPVLQTYQRQISPKTTKIASLIGKMYLWFSACGAHMFQHLSNKRQWKCIHNFTDTEYFTEAPNPQKNYLCFLGRIEDIKGTAEAIKAAQLSRSRLIIAGNIPSEHESYFKDFVQPYLSDQIKYIGPVDDEKKRDLLQNATAMLFPIKWEEPFGIVMAESMSCGTPVIGFNRGAVPEVIAHGHTGYIANNLDEMVHYISCLNLMDRSKVRAAAELRFSAKKMAQQYTQYYSEILNGIQ